MLNEVSEYIQYREIAKEIKPLKFHKDVMVSIIPPFHGAVARFLVHHNEKTVSIYLDWFDKLGCVGKPYYEIYPLNTEDADTERFLLDETDEMMERINELLNVETERKLGLDTPKEIL